MGFLALGGAGAIIVSSLFLFRIRAIRRGGVRTQGTVVDRRSDVSGASYAPVIRFATQDGRTVEFMSNMYTPFVPRVGKQVPVVYQPSTLERAILDTALGTWVIPTAFLVIGVVLCLLGLIGFLTVRSV